MCSLPPSSCLRKETKVAASIWVLPPHLRHELGLPRPNQSPASALRLHTRTVDNKNTVHSLTLSHTILGCPGMVAMQKEWMGTSTGHSQNSAHSTQQETEAQRGLWASRVKREADLSGLGAATFGTTGEICFKLSFTGQLLYSRHTAKCSMAPCPTSTCQAGFTAVLSIRKQA